MTSLVTALSRIDPAAGLVKYVTDIKPFHSKILDVQIEYVYKDFAAGTASDKPHTYISQFSLKPDVTYACGFGEQWDNHDFVNDYYQIVRATSPTEGSAESNTFVIAAPAIEEVSFFVYKTQSSTLRACTSYNITGSNSTNRTFTVAGNISSQVSAGDTVGVNITLSNGEVINTTYTVSGVVVSAGNTVLSVAEVVPNQVTYPGTLAVFTPSDMVTQWLVKPTKVSVRSTNTLPQPLNDTSEYYIHPTGLEGEFMLSNRRYPQVWDDYIHISLAGTGQLFVERTELIQPSERFTVSGSTNNRNDGQYTVKYTVRSGSTITIYVNEPIRLTTLTGNISDGAIYMGSDFGYDDTLACELASAPDLFAQGRTYEKLSFNFEFAPIAFAEGEVYENPPLGGYAAADFSGVGAFDSGANNYDATTIGVKQALILTPAGFDTTYFDVSAFDVDDINR